MCCSIAGEIRELRSWLCLGDETGKAAVTRAKLKAARGLYGVHAPTFEYVMQEDSSFDLLLPCKKQ